MVTGDKLHFLKVTKFSFCELYHFPYLSSTNFSSVNALHLSGKYFDDTLFQYGSWIYSLRHLFFIVLSYNQFQGKIPSTLGNLTSLKQINLSHNQFNFTSPGWLSKLNELSSFLLNLVSCMVRFHQLVLKTWLLLSKHSTWREDSNIIYKTL